MRLHALSGTKMKKILLIVPCYNEETRINLSSFNESFSDIEIHYLFVNDGSTDKTRLVLDSYCTKNSQARAYHLTQNAGKANAIFEAYQNSGLDYSVFDWIGYWDADLATPLDEIPRMMKFLDFYQGKDVAAIFGSRISRLGSQIKRQMHRHYLGRIFVTIVSNVLGVKCYDSQCGAKLFTPAAAEIAFKESFISRWIFDVEILLRLKEERIIEFPLFHWEDIPGSKVKVFREIFRVGNDLLKIRQKYLS